MGRSASFYYRALQFRRCPSGCRYIMESREHYRLPRTCKLCVLHGIHCGSDGKSQSIDSHCTRTPKSPLIRWIFGIRPYSAIIFAQEPDVLLFLSESDIFYDVALVDTLAILAPFGCSMASQCIQLVGQHAVDI
jgi:hypothetical protein